MYKPRPYAVLSSFDYLRATARSGIVTLLQQANIFGTYFCLIFLFRQDFLSYRLGVVSNPPGLDAWLRQFSTTSNVGVVSNPPGLDTWLRQCSNNLHQSVSSFRNEPPDTSASSWISSFQQDGIPSIYGQELLPAWTEPKNWRKSFLSWRHSRPLCNPGQRRRPFSILHYDST